MNTKYLPFLLLIPMLLIAFASLAKPVAIAQTEGITLTLTDDPCHLDIKLPYRMTWEEPGKKYTGCWGVISGGVVAVFDDKSVAAFPVQIFRPLTPS